MARDNSVSFDGGLESLNVIVGEVNECQDTWTSNPSEVVFVE